MKRVDDMSEAELDALLSQEKSVDEMNEAELDSLLAKHEEVSPIESFMTGAGKSYTFGYQPQIETVLEGLVAPGRPIQQAIPGSEEYTKRRDELIKAQESAIDANPSAGVSGEVVGAFLPGPANAVKVVKGASNLAKAGDAAVKAVGTAAVMNPGDKQGETGLQLEERLGNVADFMTDPLALGMTAIPFVPVAKDLVTNASKASMAESMAAKTLRPNAKEFRNLISDTGVSLKEVGRYLLDNKIISPRKGLEEVYQELRDRSRSTGQAIKGFYQTNANKIADYFQNNPQDLNNYNANTFNWLKQYQEIRQQVSDAFANSGQRQKALSAVEEYFGDLHKSYLTPQKTIRKPDLTELSDIKTGLDNRINYEKELKDTINEGVFKIIRTKMNESIRNELAYMSKIVGDKAGQELADLNKRFSIEATASKLANRAYSKGETASDALYRAFGFGGGFLLGGGDIPTRMALGTAGALAAPMARQAALSATNAVKRGAPAMLDALSKPIDIASPVTRARESIQYPYVERSPEEQQPKQVLNPLSPTQKAKMIDAERKFLKGK